MRWLLLGLAGAAVFLYGRITGDAQLSLLTKGIPVIALLLWLRQAPAGTYRRWIVVGLVFSLAGDILLDWPGDLFVFGLGAFLLGHLAYLRAYCSDSRQPALPALLLLAVKDRTHNRLAGARLFVPSLALLNCQHVLLLQNPGQVNTGVQENVLAVLV